MKRLILSLWFAAAVVDMASAQAPVQTLPAPATTENGNNSGIATGAYVQVWAAASAGPSGQATRRGCTIINNSASNVMYVTEGYSVAGSLDSNAVKLAVGQAYYCAAGAGMVLQGQINVKGTLADTYYAAKW